MVISRKGFFSLLAPNLQKKVHQHQQKEKHKPKAKGHGHPYPGNGKSSRPVVRYGYPGPVAPLPTLTLTLTVLTPWCLARLRHGQRRGKAAKAARGGKDEQDRLGGGQVRHGLHVRFVFLVAIFPAPELDPRCLPAHRGAVLPVRLRLTVPAGAGAVRRQGSHACFQVPQGGSRIQAALTTGAGAGQVPGAGAAQPAQAAVPGIGTERRPGHGPALPGRGPVVAHHDL